jgi:methionine-rich copper-binding protein CopC
MNVMNVMKAMKAMKAIKVTNAQTQLKSFIRRLAVVGALIVLPGAAMAHTGLKTSSPEDGAVVNQAPEALHLTFTAAVALVRLSVTDAAGKQLALDFTPSADRGTDFHVPIPAAAMQTGSLTVEWAVIGADGHTVSNAFSYTVDPSAAADAHHAHGADHQHSEEQHAAHHGDGQGH